MKDLERIREWLKTYDGMPQDGNFSIDYVRGDALSAGLISNGLVEIERAEDILGDCVVTNQLILALHVVMSKPANHDAESTRNAQWLLDFQRWVQRQSVLHKAPTFGNIDTQDETIRAQNGMAYDEADDDATIYVVTISIFYKELIPKEE